MSRDGCSVRRYPDRLGYTAVDGKPRVVPIWFHWTGQELVMASLGGAAKVAALRNQPDVAITITPRAFPQSCFCFADARK